MSYETTEMEHLLNSLPPESSCQQLANINSMVSGIYNSNFKTHYRSRSIALLWNCPQVNVTGTFDGKSTLAQAMAWSQQETSHYLSQCWPRFMLPYDITKPKWVHQENHDETVVFKMFALWFQFTKVDCDLECIHTWLDLAPYRRKQKWSP